MSDDRNESSSVTRREFAKTTAAVSGAVLFGGGPHGVRERVFC
jgi:hypothetical protein